MFERRHEHILSNGDANTDTDSEMEAEIHQLLDQHLGQGWNYREMAIQLMVRWDEEGVGPWGGNPARLI